MTDRELLELAAKAAGVGGQWQFVRGSNTPTCYRGADGRAFDPLADDGDALRLAVQLRIDVRIDNTTTLCYASNGLHQQACEKHTDHADPYSDLWADLFRATRHAIVRAAAEIGKGVA